MFSMQELEEEESLIIEQMEGYSDNALPPACLEINLDEIGRCIENYAESNVAELAEGQLIYEKEAVHSNAFPFYSSKDDVSYVISGGCLVSEEVAFDGNAFPSSQAKENITYSSSRLRGLIDGEQWELFYEGIDGREAQQSIDIYSCESTVPYDLSTVRMDDKSVEKYGQNQSDFELSQKAAQDMLDKLGYENMELIDTGQRVFQDGGESWMNGYKLSFARSIGSMQIGFNSDSIVMLGVPGDEGYHYGVQQEYIHVYVSDNSVYMLTIDNVVEIGDMLSAGEQNSLMSFDKIDSIARGLIEETWDYTDPLTIDNVCLKYLVLPFEEGRYALMPVWLYYGDYEGDYEENSWYKKSACICLNAVDGSEIHLSGPAVSTFWRAKSLID